ncbi:DUF6879 family protein [Streptomyces millisiae]|uniref:DUF6879 domain-containing protein n=1 Tax=Streptomyces millisiae TaxID=3075542 RepID=A0ABU2LMY8_9ACTN|nr:DUF6879 family protein [Streptomyces sp. DSM 44918]MDT0318418.1 hypothetical protein [Streptomyces sp. DSM 44918]
MLDLSLPPLDPAQGQRLERSAYKTTFWQDYERIYEHDSWKLERRQHFEEQGSASRAALRRGDWGEALRLLEDKRDALRRDAEQDRRQRTVFHRVRVVERPFTPYMQWELHSLRLNAEDGGEAIRVIDAADVATLESKGRLPEVVVLGEQSLYEVIYTEAGVPDGGIRFSSPDLVEGWENLIKRLFDRGEDIATYFAREVAPLPPPRITTQE